MSEVVTNSISPLLPDFFIVAALTAWAPLTPLIGGRIAPNRDGLDPQELVGPDASYESAWPYVLFGPSEDGQFDLYAQTDTLLEATFLVRAFMLESIATGRGEDFEDATAAIHAELQQALTAFGATEITRENGSLRGTVHGCELLPQLHRVTYGERGHRVSEMGVYVRISCN